MLKDTMFWPLDLFLVVMLTFLIAGMVKGVIGMALPTVSLGVLAAMLGLKEAIVLILVPSFLTNVWQGILGGHFVILMKRLWLLLSAMLISIWFGAGALTMTDTSVLEVLLGILLVTYGAFGLITRQMPAAGRYESWMSPVIGSVTGVFAGLTGSTVFPVVPYLQALGMPRDVFIQAMGICFSTAALGIGLALGGRNLLPLDLSLLSIIGIVPAFTGMLFGRSLRKRFSEQRFKQVFLISMIFLGGYITITSNVS